MQGRMYNHEVTIRTRSGEIENLLCSGPGGFRMGANGIPVRIVETGEDIIAHRVVPEGEDWHPRTCGWAPGALSDG